MTESPTYDEVETALAEVGAEHGAAAAHGLLGGMQAVPGGADAARWIAQVLENTSPRGEEAKICLARLMAVHQSTQAQMDDEALGFQPLLPSDSEPLSVRARALGRWAEGFLLGLGLGGIGAERKFAPEVSEALRDLAEISRVELDAEAGEENEAAYAELVEYVRMAALLVRESLLPKPAKPSAQSQPQAGNKTLH